MIVVPAAIIVLGIYIFQGLSITAPAQTQTIEWIKVIPYIIVLGTAIAGMNVMLVLIIGILTRWHHWHRDRQLRNLRLVWCHGNGNYRNGRTDYYHSIGRRDARNHPL